LIQALNFEAEFPYNQSKTFSPSSLQLLNAEDAAETRAMNIEDMIRAVQEELGIGVDGRAGPKVCYFPASPRCDVVGAVGVELGLEWGGDWTTVKDRPHFQLRRANARNRSETAMLAELRTHAASGRGFYA
jgi:hypothetical protein